MIINSVTSLIALLSITTLIIYFLYLNLDDIKFIIHSVIGSTFENFNETIDNVKLPTNVVDISLNEIIKNSNPHKRRVPYKLVSTMRAGVLTMGSLLGRYQKKKFMLPKVVDAV